MEDYLINVKDAVFTMSLWIKTKMCLGLGSKHVMANICCRYFTFFPYSKSDLVFYT